jgi:hypothetical protein
MELAFLVRGIRYMVMEDLGGAAKLIPCSSYLNREGADGNATHCTCSCKNARQMIRIEYRAIEA